MTVDWGMGGAGLLIGVVVTVMWAAIFIGLIVLIVLGIRWLMNQGREADRRGGYPPAGPGPLPPRADDPLEILRQRYARGEIDDEEFERRRKTLTGG
jgi:putative membrane protein